MDIELWGKHRAGSRISLKMLREAERFIERNCSMLHGTVMFLIRGRCAVCDCAFGGKGRRSRMHHE